VPEIIKKIRLANIKKRGTGGEKQRQGKLTEGIGWECGGNRNCSGKKSGLRAVGRGKQNRHSRGWQVAKRQKTRGEKYEGTKSSNDSNKKSSGHRGTDEGSEGD